MTASSQGVLRWIAYFWIGILAYIFVGGAVAQGLGFAGVIGPYCADTVQQQDTYPACVPCGLNWSIFGVIEVTPCDSPLLTALLTYGVAWPHTFIVMLAVLAHPIAGTLRELAFWLAPTLLLPLAVAALLRTTYFNFFERRDVVRGTHRALLVGCVLLATLMAVSI